MNYTVSLSDASSVRIGEAYRSANNVEIMVSAGPEDSGGAPVRITVTVGCGATAADLLASRNDRIRATCLTGGERKNMAPDSPDNRRAWNSGARGITLPASIRLEDFVSQTPPGMAEITLLVQKAEGPNRWSAGAGFPLRVTKQLEKGSEPAIDYFSVDPGHILHAGQTEVTLGFCATGFDTLTLLRNNEEIRVWQGGDGAVAGDYRDKPSLTSVYRIEGSYRNGGERVRCSLDRIVQVISSGWNQVALAQGTPVRLFVANDFSGSGAMRLYGIFRGDNGRYTLCSSATGVDGWRLEPGDVPEHMATSPGVSWNNRLWLIGGSSVNPEVCGNEVWCFEALQWVKKSHSAVGDKPPWFERMGHACVVFPRESESGRVEEEIWLFGGYNNGECFSDLWRGRADDQGRLVWDEINADCPWCGRLNHAAATVRNGAGGRQVWMYGGAQTPQATENLYDLWTTDDGNTWENRKTGHGGSAIVPAPGRPLGSALAASRTDGESDRLFLIGSFREWAAGVAGGEQGNRVASFIFEWQGDNPVWEVRPILDGWQQFRGDNFYMQALAFNRFLFVWSLPAQFDSTLKLNILVPR